MCPSPIRQSYDESLMAEKDTLWPQAGSVVKCPQNKGRVSRNPRGFFVIGKSTLKWFAPPFMAAFPLKISRRCPCKTAPCVNSASFPKPSFRARYSLRILYRFAHKARDRIWARKRREKRGWAFICRCSGSIHLKTPRSAVKERFSVGGGKNGEVGDAADFS